MQSSVESTAIDNTWNEIAPEVERQRTLSILGWTVGFFLAIWLLGFSYAVPLTIFLYLKFVGNEKWPITIAEIRSFWQLASVGGKPRLGKKLQTAGCVGAKSAAKTCCI